MIGTLRDIQLFVAAYETTSFTGAALRENCTQSGVSQHMRRLENQLGSQLFLRQGGRVIPTPAGHAYYGACVELLKWHEESVRVARTFNSDEVGELVVGVMPTLSRVALAPALSRFANRYPNISVRIIEGYSGLLTRLVQSGELDFAVIPEARNADGLRIRTFFVTEEVLASGASRKLAGKGRVCLSELGPLKIVLPSPNNIRYQALETYFRQHEVRIERKMELDAMLATLSLIASTDWVAILPALMFNPQLDSEIITTNAIAPSLPLALVSAERARTTLPHFAEAFREMLLHECQELQRVNGNIAPLTDA